MREPLDSVNVTVATRDRTQKSLCGTLVPITAPRAGYAGASIYMEAWDRRIASRNLDGCLGTLGATDHLRVGILSPGNAGDGYRGP